ncbi:MAG: leucine-rich repeat domain-containing protein [Ruminococcus albus]|nr:leucine-rich repeat domain-containing protein [Ruminococcus albus]
MKSKKIIAGLLALTFVFGGVVLPSGVVSNSLVASATEFSEYQDVMDILILDDYSCLLLKDGTLEIENYIGKNKDIEIPSVLDGKTVTRIGSPSFQTRDVDSVVIPDSVTRIEDNAFNSCTLKSVTIPNSVEYIGERSFSNCKSLENIEIPSSVKALGRYAFDRCCSLESVTLNDGLSIIGYSAFSYCERLKSIEIPSSVEKIDDFAFYRCSSLKSLKLNSGLRYIGECAFSSCDFPQIEIPDSVEEIGKYAFELNKSLKSVILPKELKTFGYYVFYNCSNLESVNIPDDLTFIPNGTFHECVNLKRIIIPASVTTIGDYAFTYFDSEKKAYLPIPDLTISCYSGSYAEKYAKENGLKYQLIKPKLTYPTNIKFEYNQIYHQARLTWDKVEDADRYGIALYLAGKWRIQKQDITTTSYTTPKNMTPGTSYKLAIAARVDGEWDIANAIKHAVTISIPNDTDSAEDGIEDIYEKEENVSSYTIAPIIDSWIDDSESISGNNPKIPDLKNSGMNMRGSSTLVSPEDNNGPRKNELIAIRKRKSGSTDAKFSITPSRNSDFAFTITGTKETKFGEEYTTDDYESTVKVFYEKGVIFTEEEQVEPVKIKPSKNGTEITYVFALEQDKDYKIYVNNPTNDHKGEYEIHVSEDNWVYATKDSNGQTLGVVVFADDEHVTLANKGAEKYSEFYFSEGMLKHLVRLNPKLDFKVEYVNQRFSKTEFVDDLSSTIERRFKNMELIKENIETTRGMIGKAGTVATMVGLVSLPLAIPYAAIFAPLGSIATVYGGSLVLEDLIISDSGEAKLVQGFNDSLIEAADAIYESHNYNLCLVSYIEVTFIDSPSGTGVRKEPKCMWSEWKTQYINKYPHGFRTEIITGLSYEELEEDAT